MEFITPQIAIGLLLISIGVVSKFDIKFEIFKEKEWKFKSVKSNY